MTTNELFELKCLLEKATRCKQIIILLKNNEDEITEYKIDDIIQSTGRFSLDPTLEIYL